MGNEEMILCLEIINEELKESHQELDKFKAKEKDFNLLSKQWKGARKAYQTKIEEVKSLLNQNDNTIAAKKNQTMKQDPMTAFSSKKITKQNLKVPLLQPKKKTSSRLKLKNNRKILSTLGNNVPIRE
jgi:hypothetical protein